MSHIVAILSRPIRPKHLTISQTPMEVFGMQIDRVHELAISVDTGVVEFVIGGKIGTVVEGGMARVPVCTAYAYRNTDLL